MVKGGGVGEVTSTASDQEDLAKDQLNILKIDEVVQESQWVWWRVGRGESPSSAGDQVESVKDQLNIIKIDLIVQELR